jgi:hypothetical protein
MNYENEGVLMMRKTFLLAGLACAVLITAPAMAQHDTWYGSSSGSAWSGSSYGYPWSGSAGGAIGGYGILGTTPSDNAPLLALNIDRNAHISGNYQNALVKFDRVIRADGTAVLMRRVTDPRYPNIFGYLPKSWPLAATMGVERVHSADGSVTSTRNVIIPESEIRDHPIPMDGPKIGTLVIARDIMSNGAVQMAATVIEPEPSVAVALLGSTEHGTTYYVPGQTVVVASR